MPVRKRNANCVDYTNFLFAVLTCTVCAKIVLPSLQETRECISRPCFLGKALAALLFFLLLAGIIGLF